MVTSETAITEVMPAQRRRTSMVSAAAILMAGFVLSRLLGLIRVGIQASVLKASGHDGAAFTTAIAIPDTVFTIVSGGALGSSFIPVFAALLEKGDEERAWRVASGVMNGVLVVMGAAIVVAELAAPSIVGLLSDPRDQALTVTLTRITLLQPLFLTIAGILMGLYNSYHRFVAPAIAPLVYNVANIVGLLLIPVFHHAVALAAWGVTVGALLQVVLMLPILFAVGRPVRPGGGLAEPGTREVGRLMAPRIIGQAGIQFTTLVSIALANHGFMDRPSMAIRIAGYVLALPVGIFGNAIATAAFPTLAGQAARGDLVPFATTILRTLNTMVFFATPAAVALIVLRYPVTETLVHSSRHDIDVVASGILGFAVGIPVWTAVELLPRVFFALKDTWTPVLINLVTLSTAIVLSVIGVALVHGDSVVGVGLLTGALTISVLMEVVWLGLVLRRRVHAFGVRAIGLSCLRAAVASEAMGVALLAVLYLWQRFGPRSAAGDVLLVCVAIPLGLAVYVGWAYVVEAPELAMAWAMVRARLLRRRAA